MIGASNTYCRVRDLLGQDFRGNGYIYIWGISSCIEGVQDTPVTLMKGPALMAVTASHDVATDC